MIAAGFGAAAGVGEAAGLEVVAAVGAATAMIGEDFGAAAGVGVAAGLGAAAAVPGSGPGLEAAAGIVVVGASLLAEEGAVAAGGVAAWLSRAGLLAEGSRLAAAGLVVIRCGAARTLVAAGLRAAGKPIVTGRGVAACLLLAVFELVPAGRPVAGVEVLRPRDAELLLSEPRMNDPPASPNTNAATTSATTSHVDFRSRDLSTVWRASSRAPGRLEVMRPCSRLTWAPPVACRAAGRAKSANSASHSAPRTISGKGTGLVRSVTLNIAASQP